MPRVVIAALLVVVGLGCNSLQSGDSESHSVLVQKGSDFDLMTGETARVSGSFVNITFTGVREDSRCPTDVQCVWQGNAVVGLALRHANGPATDTVLSLNLEPHSMRYENFFVTVRDLMPQRRTDHPLKQEEYTVTLRVTEH
jgi:hypothetical protein